MYLRVIAALGCVCGAAAETSYQWPLDLPRAVTSSFAEYRAGRFHAGIDLRTGGVGKDVFASADGHISRLRCSPYGYGKAVYLTLHDGNLIVYGHLDAFAEPMAEYVRQAQHRAKSYTVDLEVPAGQFPVTRGQLIAKSGQTGIGAPHLHYEIRDAANRPINPRRIGITWPDDSRPIIRKVLVSPADEASSVEGDFVPVVLTAKADGQGHYKCDRITASGRIGFGVDVLDLANGGESKLGVYILRTALDGQEVFRMQHESLSYDDMNNGAVSYHPYFLGEGQFLLQWRWPDNRCSSYSVSPGSGWIDVPGGDSTVVIYAEDANGNASSVTIDVHHEPVDVKHPDVANPRGRGAVSVECFGELMVYTVRFSEPEPTSPSITVSGAAIDAAFRRVSGNTFRATIPLARCRKNTQVEIAHPRMDAYSDRVDVYARDDAGTSMAGMGEVRVAAGSAYGALPVKISQSNSMRGSPGLEPAGDAFTVWPEPAPIDREVEIAVPIAEDVREDTRVGLYRQSGSGWSYVGASRGGDRLVTTTRRFGTYQAMRDDAPPELKITSPDLTKPIETRRPRIRATIADNASGVADITASCGGQWLLMEYDPERNRLSWARDEDLPSGEQTLQIVVTDNAGNTTTREVVLRVPG